jgi:hypothetical protein
MWAWSGFWPILKFRGPNLMTRGEESDDDSDAVDDRSGTRWPRTPPDPGGRLVYVFRTGQIIPPCMHIDCVRPSYAFLQRAASLGSCYSYIQARRHRAPVDG